MAATSLDELALFDFRDSWDKAVPRLRSIFQDTAHLEITLAHMNSVLTFLTRFNIRRKIYVSPLSSYNEKFYTGNLLFQCLHDQKRRSVFAAGGRYDQLIRDHQPIVSKRSHVHAVGCQLTWTGLCGDMTNYIKGIAKLKAKKKLYNSLNAVWRTRRCDVLVKSFDQDLLDSVGAAVLQELWASNISSELAESNNEDTPENPFTKTQERSEEYGWIISIKSEDLMKVKNTMRNDETELKLSELAGHILSEIRERDRLEERTPKASLLRHSSQQEPNPSAKDRDVDIKVLMSQTKGKKVNRKTIVEEGKFTREAGEKKTDVLLAQHHRQLFLQDCADSPIIAVETKDEIFDGIGDTRLSDPESWRRFIQNAAPGERQYLGQLQNMLKNMAKEASQTANANAIIYNFRTKACISYNLGRPVP